MMTVMHMHSFSKIATRLLTSLNSSLALLLMCFAIAPCAFSANEADTPRPKLLQKNFIYTPSEMLSFDIEAFLLENAPNLAEHAEAISHWSGRSSISPKIIISLIEHQSQSISHSDLASKLDGALLNLSTKENLSKRIQDVATRLADHYYKNLAKDVAEPEIKSLDALLQGSADASAAQKLKVDNTTSQFAKTFFTLFPKELTTTATQQRSKQLKSVPAPNLLQLPYPIGQAWQTWGGTHTFTGSGSAPYSSLDFRQNRGAFGTNTSNIWVSSASQGSAVKHSSCSVEVLAPGGWSTTYYHLDNVQINTGQNVSQNTRLANYADNLSQSICGGGQSNGPHLHFSLKRNGVYVALDGVKLSGYEVHAGRSNYDSNCNYFWLGDSNAKFCNGTPIRNNAPSTTTPDLSVSAIQTNRQELDANEPFSISTMLNNLGTTSSAAGRLIFLLSTDSTITLADTALAESATDGLLAGESKLYTSDSLLLSDAGEFWLGACVVSVTGETNITNNCTQGLSITVNEKQGDTVIPAIKLLLDED